MAWNEEEAKKPTTAATDVPESAQVTSEHFSPHSARLNGSDFRSTTNSIDSKPNATWRDTQIRLRLDTARVLRRAVQQQFQARPKATLKDWAGTGVRQKLQRKVALTETLLQKLHQRLEGTDALHGKVNQCMSLLLREHQALEEPAIVCERRILIRERRDEDVEDEFQTALLQERHVLEQASKMLSAYLDAGNELGEALQAAKSEMVEDVQFKRHALRLEKSALQFDSFHGRDRACVLPLVADNSQKLGAPAEEDVQWKFGATFLSLEKDDWSEENPANESVQRSAQHTTELLSRTQELESNTTQFVTNSATLLQSVKTKVLSAHEATSGSMRASIARLQQQKKELEIGLAECQEDLTRTESLLEHMREEIRSQKASLDEWEATPEISLDRFDQRLPLAVQQDIRQSAFERMQEQVHNTKSNVHVLSNKCEESKDLLCQLQESSQELREHLNAKTAAWRIDLQCAKLKSGKDAMRSTTRSKDSSMVAPKPVALSNQMLDVIRWKIKNAAYEGPHGPGFDVIFNRFDQDGSGCLGPLEVRSALRRALRIPESSVSDQQICSLCAWLDIDGSGAIEIDELVAFLSMETQSPRLQKKITAELGAQVSNRSLELDCFVTPRRRPMASKPGRSQPLNQETLKTIRSKIQAGAYAGQLGCEVKALFSRFDHTGSGVLEEGQLRQVLRRGMRIPAAVIPDDHVTKLCAMLDTEGSGVIGIDRLVSFVGKPEVRARKLHNTV